MDNSLMVIASVLDDERVLEIDLGNNYTILGRYLMPLNCMFKNG